MLKINSAKDFFILLGWVFLASWLINAILDAIDKYTPTTFPPLKLWYRQPVTQATKTVASATSSTTGASGS